MRFWNAPCTHKTHPIALWNWPEMNPTGPNQWMLPYGISRPQCFKLLACCLVSLWKLTPAHQTLETMVYISHHHHHHHHLYYNYEKYPLSPLKPRFLVLIEQYLPNISDPVYSVHQSFMWFLWLNWHKSTFIPSLLQMIQNVDLLWRHRYKSRPPAIVTSQWPRGCYGRFLSTVE